MRNGVGRGLLVACGFVSVGVGVVGIVVPLLPTTPFLLLAAYCFLRGSPRWHAWLLDSPVAGPYLRGYLEQGAVPQRTKIVALVILWGSIGVSCLVVGNWIVGVLLVAIGTGVTIHIVRLKTLR